MTELQTARLRLRHWRDDDLDTIARWNADPFVMRHMGRPPMTQEESEEALARYRRHWDEHVSTALRVHVGLTKYERNWVDEVMSWSVGAQPVDAYADFSFRTARDFLDNFFPGEGDRLEVTQDIVNFVASGSGLFLNDPQPIFG